MIPNIYSPLKDGESGYTFWHHLADDTWGWRWHEPDEKPAIVDGFHSLPEAMRSAADDWDTNGSSRDKRFSGMLRGLATKGEK